MRTDNQIVSRGIYTGAMVLILVWLSGCASYRTNTDLKFGLFETVEIPSDFLIIKGDLVDIPYTHVGPVKAIVKKLSMFHDDPTKAQADLVLYHQAAAIGADAVIWVWYESGESWDSWGYLKAEGLAVRTQRGADDEEKAKEEIQTYPQFVDMASKEIDSKKYDKVLWVRALSLAEGDVEKQKDIYIKLRSNQLASQAAKVSPWGTPDRSIQIASEKEKAELNIAMQPCIEHARSTFPETLKRYQSGRLQGTAFFVIVLSDQKTINYIIVENFEDGQIRGRVEAQGITFKGRYYPQGSMIDLGAADIIDWYVLYPDRPPEGNLLGRYLLMRMDGLTSEACHPAHREFQHYRVYTRTYSFVAPDTEGWEMYGPDKETGTHKSMQEKKGKNLDELNTLSGTSYRITPGKTDQELIESAMGLGRYGDEEGVRYNVVKLEAEIYPHRQARCARSLHIVEDKKALLSKSGKRGFMIRDVQSLLCIHPADDQVAVLLRYSHRHHPGKKDPEFYGKANRVFESLAFTKK